MSENKREECAECKEEIPENQIVWNELVEAMVCKSCDDELFEKEEWEQAMDELISEEW